VTDRRLRLAAIVLAVLGLGVAAYLTYVHYEGVRPVCGLGGNCEKVQTSEWSKLGGVPVALLGLLGYVAILGSLFVDREEALVAGALIALVGFGFSAYLTYRLYLDPDLDEALARRAADEGLTKAEFIRRTLAGAMQKPRRPKPHVGVFRSTDGLSVRRDWDEMMKGFGED
jgi:hypothetical protein